MKSRAALMLACVAALALASGCGKAKVEGPSPDVAADTIYTGGDIVTVNDAQPTAEAVAVKDGRIVAVGTRVEVEKAHKGAATTVVDLAGRTLVPGFVDGHAHFLAFGSQAVGVNLLAPPDGTVNTIDDLVAKLQEFAKGPDVGRTGWIFGLGYDDALLGRHPTRDDLDKVSKDIPVIAVHISGHFSAMNSAGLAKAPTRIPGAASGVAPGGQPLAGAMLTVGISVFSGDGNVGVTPVPAGIVSLAMSPQPASANATMPIDRMLGCARRTLATARECAFISVPRFLRG